MQAGVAFLAVLTDCVLVNVTAARATPVPGMLRDWSTMSESLLVLTFFAATASRPSRVAAVIPA